MEVVISFEILWLEVLRDELEGSSEVELGKIDINDLPSIIDSTNRDLAGPTARAHGLYLEKVHYDL